MCAIEMIGPGGRVVVNSADVPNKLNKGWKVLDRKTNAETKPVKTKKKAKKKED